MAYGTCSRCTATYHFPFRDQFELWLLDHRRQLLALLHSVRTDSETDYVAAPRLARRHGAQAHFSECGNCRWPNLGRAVAFDPYTYIYGRMRRRL